jgi:uncharacterized protein (DUF433 family)
MAVIGSQTPQEPWRQRLALPNYQIGEAAKYAHISANTVAAWHKQEHPTLSAKDKGAALSYLQLIEVSVVAAFRRANIKLPRIRRAREFFKQELGLEFPFAQYKFKHDGKHILADYQQIEGEKGKGKQLMADEWGQLEWDEIVGPLLQEFEYEHQGIVIRWHVDGLSSPILIDPRINFGAPSVKGTPTWIIAGRWNAGERNSSIAEDFGLTVEDVRKALRFEGLQGKGRKSSQILH